MQDPAGDTRMASASTRGTRRELRRRSSIPRRRVAALIALPLVAFLSSLVIGRYPIPPSTIALTLLSKILPIEPTWEPVVEVIVFDVRLPRAILALAVGASLAISGTAFQAMFQNPLVSSDILGVSAGAGFGAALAIAVSTGPLAIQASAFLFGLVAVGLAYAISRQFRTTVMLLLVLAGIVVGSVFSALISLVTYTVDPQRKLPAIVFWLLGSLSTSSTRDLVDALPLMAFGIGGLLLLRWRLNVLSLGDEEARSLGVNVELLRIVVIGCATVVTAAAVSISGIIGWVGLVIPHVARMLVGPDHRVLLPASVAIGGTYLLLIDNLARSVTTAELPLSILTAIIGAPFFAYLLRRTRGTWG